VSPGDRRPALVVFEGLDGAGKTTLARMTAAALGGEPMTTPSPEVRRYRDELIASFGDSQEACQLFYLATVFAASAEIRARLAAGRCVVLDRYFLSTQAYARFRGSALDLDALGDLLVPADLTVFVHAPLAVRLERLGRRGATAADRETMAPLADARLRAEHEQRLGLPVVGRALELDSSTASPDDLVAAVLAALADR
jgi:dTMP kinase